MKARYLITILIFVIAAFFAWSGLVKNVGKEEKKEKPNSTIRVAYAKYVSQFFIAEDTGFYKEQGLNVELKLIPNSSATIQAIEKGEIDVATLPYSLLFSFESASPGNFKIFGSTVETEENPYSFLIVKKGVNDVKDLKGKKIVIRSGLNSKIQAEMVLKALGMDPNEVTIVQVEPPLTVSVFAKEEISAAIDVEPSATAMLQNNLGKILNKGVRPKYITSPYPTVANIFATKFVERDPVAAEKFRLATEKALDFTKLNEKEARAILQKYMELDENLAKSMRLPVDQKLSEIDKEAIGNLINIEVEHGLLDKEINLENTYYRP